MKRILYLLRPLILMAALSVGQAIQSHGLSMRGGTAGENWFPIGPPGIQLSNNDTISGQVNAIAVHPKNADILYIGAAEGGVWKTLDGGSSWKALTDFQLVRDVPVGGGKFVSRATLSIGSLAIDPSNPEVIYAGTGDPNRACCFFGSDLGVFRSGDGGNTWTPLGTVFRAGCTSNETLSRARVNKIVVRPGSPSEVFAATNAGLFKYKDDGADCWQHVTDGLPVSDTAIDMVRDTAGGDLYIAFHGKGIFKTTDLTGDKWKALTSGLPTSGFGRIALAISPSQPAVLYAGIDVGGQYRLFKTENAGNTWIALPHPPSDGQLDFGNVIAISPRGSDFVYIGQVALWRATDGGKVGGLNDYNVTPPVNNNSWTTLSCCLSDGNPSRGGLDLHADLHDIVFAPKNSFAESTSTAEIVFIVNDGGVTKGTINDIGVVTWYSLTTGLTLGQFGTIGLSPSNVNEVIGGFWHNGNAFTRNHGSSWERFGIGGGGDGFQASIDVARPVSMHGDRLTVMYVNTNAFGGGAITRVRADFNHVIPPPAVQEQIWSNNDTVVHWCDPYHDGDLLRLQGGKIFRAHDAATKPASDLNTDAAWELIDPPAKSGDSATLTFERRLDVDNKPAYFLGTTTGQIWRGSPEVGWEKVCDCGGEFDNKKHEIAIDLNNPNRIVAVFKGTGPGRVKEVKRSPGGGWVSKVIDDKFNPPLQIDVVYTIVVDPLDSNTVFVGTDQGAYRGRLESGNWLWARSPGIPNVSVPDLEAHQRFLGTQTGVVRAGTYGRGIFELERTTPIIDLTCPADIVVSALPGQNSVVVNYPPLVMNSPGGAVVLFSPPSGSVFPAGSTLVSLTVIDASGNEATCTFTVTVNLAGPPPLALSCAGDLQVIVPSGQPTVVSYPQPVLNKPEGATVVCSPPSGSSFPVGTTTVTCAASNTGGETASCAFIINVH